VLVDWLNIRGRLSEAEDGVLVISAMMMTMMILS
jgi:hypothetical protein